MYIVVFIEKKEGQDRSTHYFFTWSLLLATRLPWLPFKDACHHGYTSCSCYTHRLTVRPLNLEMLCSEIQANLE